MICSPVVIVIGLFEAGCLILLDQTGLPIHIHSLPRLLGQCEKKISGNVDSTLRG